MVTDVVAKTIKPLFARSIPHCRFRSSAILVAALLQTMAYGSHQ